MAKLSETNPHLRNAAKREEIVFRAVVSSSALEGIIVDPKSLKAALRRGKKKPQGG